MASNRKVWVAIYLLAFAIFFGGYFASVHQTSYFPYFVGFCMAYGLTSIIYWWRTHRVEPKD